MLRELVVAVYFSLLLIAGQGYGADASDIAKRVKPLRNTKPHNSMYRAQASHQITRPKSTVKFKKPAMVHFKINIDTGGHSLGSKTAGNSVFKREVDLDKLPSKLT